MYTLFDKVFPEVEINEVQIFLQNKVVKISRRILYAGCLSSNLHFAELECL